MSILVLKSDELRQFFYTIYSIFSYEIIDINTIKNSLCSYHACGKIY